LLASAVNPLSKPGAERDVSLVIDADWAGDMSILGQVLLINLVLSGDNAVVVALAVTGLPLRYRLRALWLGIAMATGLRVLFALAATRLLQILGLTLAGGILLLWVAWKLWRELLHSAGPGDAATRERAESKSLGKALWQIVLADVSMSLDNALAVAGVAINHPMMLFVGLATSVLLMGLAAAAIARLLDRWRWIAYLGLAVIVYVALKMIWTGTHEVIGTVT
jgi:YjbE family integral membrane protein